MSIVVSACAAMTRQSVVESSPYLHRPPTLEELRETLRAREEALRSFRGQARLDYRGDLGSGKSSEMIMVSSPDLVRIDVMSPFGPTYTVASDGRQLHAYDRGEKVLYVGAASASNLRTYTRVSLEVRVLALLIRGLPPFVLDRAKNERIVETKNGWRYEADLANEGFVRLDVERTRLRPVRVELGEPSVNGTITVEFGDYRGVDGVDVAHRVYATLADASTVELEYSRVWREVGLAASVFQIHAPAGVRVVPMELEVGG